MRFIGNNHALHFGGVTFVNRVTLVKEVIEEMARFDKTEAQQEEIARIIGDVVDQMEDELREELQQKHYHADLHIPTEK
jgi:DNA-binding ferritin-like protein (Dps family)